ncbi:hypothetical protein [Vibrio owensii]|uniref:hypothetical protein n=1 Tax=Vibrio owensii TaxID=696485 RepID=UPI0018F250A1|nr:hypothetical protein [Vibrio owensii]
MYSHIDIELKNIEGEVAKEETAKLLGNINIGNLTITHSSGRKCTIGTESYGIDNGVVNAFLADSLENNELTEEEFLDFDNLKVEIYANLSEHISSNWALGKAKFYTDDESLSPDGIHMDIEGMEYNECHARTIGCLLLEQEGYASVPTSYEVTVLENDQVVQKRFSDAPNGNQERHPFFHSIERCINLDLREPRILSIFGRNILELRDLIND